MIGRLAKRPTNLGVSGGRLASCPTSPNCVSTQASDARHAIEPIAYAGDPAAAISCLQSILQEQPRTRIVTARADYLHAEVASAFFGFVDDVEFFVNQPKQQIEFRSAARTGRTDLGVNRKRMELVREAFTRLQPAGQQASGDSTC